MPSASTRTVCRRIFPVWGMVKRVGLVIAHRTDAYPFKITDNVDSLDFPEIHCHVQFLKSVSLSLSYLYSLPSLTTMPFAIRCLSHITNEVRPRL